MKSSRSLAFLRRRLPSTAQSAGAAARRSGNSLESAIAAVNEWYERRQEALIEKVNPPAAGWGDTLRLGASTVDFTGTFWHPLADETCQSGGTVRRVRGVAFDVKSWTGKAMFGVGQLPKGKEAGRHRARFLRQVDYLRNARDRHGYAAFFLLYCSDLDTLWLCDDLSTLAAGESVPVRDMIRGTKATPGRVEHRLPHITSPGGSISLLGLAAIVRPDTWRPYLDYLSLLNR